MTLPPLILASVSPRRRELLAQIIPDFLVVSSDASELEDVTLPPRRLCEINAQRKAFAVVERHPDHLVLAADTLVFLDHLPLGKPSDLNQARAMLARLSGRIHEVITGICLAHHRAQRVRLFAEATRVKFRVLSTNDIDEYLARVNVLDKAGAYALQEEGHRIVEQVEGSYTNVVGLPLEAVRMALAQWGG